ESFIDLVGFGELQSDAHEIQTEKAHPARSIRLFEDRTTRQLVATIDYGDVVKSKEAALEDVVAFSIDLIHPPGKVDQQLVEDLFQKFCIGDSIALAIKIVDAPAGPGMHRRIQIGKLPFIGRNLAVGMLKLFKEQHPQILFSE